MNISLLGVPPLSPLYATSVLLKVPPSSSVFQCSRCSRGSSVPDVPLFQCFSCSRCSSVPDVPVFQLFQCFRFPSVPGVPGAPDVSVFQMFKAFKFSSAPGVPGVQVFQCSSVPVFKVLPCSSVPGAPALQEFQRSSVVGNDPTNGQKLGNLTGSQPRVTQETMSDDIMLRGDTRHRTW